MAAILKTGLRIMPHSGGRVGRGIYFASENSKSAGYGNGWLYIVGCGLTDCNYCIVSCAQNTGIMFLNEVVLGKEHGITRDNSSLRKAPEGFDSVVARGQTEPGESVLFYY